MTARAYVIVKEYGVGDHLLEGIVSFCEDASVGVGVREGCIMSPRLFNIYMDGFMREVRARVGDLGSWLIVRGVEQLFAAGWFLRVQERRLLTW